MTKDRVRGQGASSPVEGGRRPTGTGEEPTPSGLTSHCSFDCSKWLALIGAWKAFQTP